MFQWREFSMPHWIYNAASPWRTDGRRLENSLQKLVKTRKQCPTRLPELVVLKLNRYLQFLGAAIFQWQIQFHPNPYSVTVGSRKCVCAQYKLTDLTNLQHLTEVVLPSKQNTAEISVVSPNPLCISIKQFMYPSNMSWACKLLVAVSSTLPIQTWTLNKCQTVAVRSCGLGVG